MSTYSSFVYPHLAEVVKLSFKRCVYSTYTIIVVCVLYTKQKQNCNFSRTFWLNNLGKNAVNCTLILVLALVDLAWICSGNSSTDFKLESVEGCSFPELPMVNCM